MIPQYLHRHARGILALGTGISASWIEIGLMLPELPSETPYAICLSQFEDKKTNCMADISYLVMLHKLSRFLYLLEELVPPE